MSEAALDQTSEERASGASIRLERKHPLAIRWMHWINFPILFTMIWSGLLIYWNDSDNAYQHPTVSTGSAWATGLSSASFRTGSMPGCMCRIT